MMFEVIGSSGKEYGRQLQRACYALGDYVVVPGDDVDGVVAPQAVGHSDAVDEALLYLCLR